jgi:hypothetical protein
MTEDRSTPFGRIEKGFAREDIEEIFNIQKDWNPSGDDKLYFLPGCTVPRFKVREKYTCTISPKKATAAFISKENLSSSDSLFTKEYLYKLSKDDRTVFLNNLKSKWREKFKPLVESLLTNGTIEGVYLAKPIWEYSYNAHPFASSRLYDILTNSEWYIKDQIRRGQHHHFTINRDSKLNELTCPVYLENDILKLLNEDKMIVDTAKYNELRLMGQSTDMENVKILMNLMANSNFEKSAGKLLFLIKEFDSKFMQTPDWDSVNFKSLLSFLGLTKKDFKYGLRLDKSQEVLKNTKSFTKENVMLLGSLYAGHAPSGDLTKMFSRGPVLRTDQFNLLDE